MRFKLLIAAGAVALVAASHAALGQVRTRSAAAVDPVQLQQQIAALQTQVQALQSVIQVQGTGLTIRTNGDIELRSNSGDVRVRAKNVRLEGSIGVQAKATGSVQVESAGQTVVKGASVRLTGPTFANNQPVTTAGKPVMGTCPPTGGPLIGAKVLP